MIKFVGSFDFGFSLCCSIEKRFEMDFQELNKVAIYRWMDIKEDIVRFIPDDRPLEIRSKDYFKELAKRIRFVEKQV